MDHTWADGQVEFASRAWRKLFEIREPLVRELILEIFSKCKIAQRVLDLDTLDTLQFQLGGHRYQMSYRQFILALVLHTAKEMATDVFGVYLAKSSRVMASKADLSDYCIKISSTRDFLTMFPSYTAIKEPLRRLCHRLIAFTIAGRGQAPKKVTTTDLYYLRRMYKGTVNVPYMLAQYLFRHTEGRKERAKMSRGHFIVRLAEHFGLLTGERLQGLTMVVRDLTEIDMNELVAAAGATQADQEIPKEGVQDDPTPVQAPRAPPATPSSRIVPQRLLRLEEEVHGLRDSIREQHVLLERMSINQERLSTWVVDRITQLMHQSGLAFLRFDGRLVGCSPLSYKRRRVRQRTDGDANTLAAPHARDYDP
ncbi:hypothetical protein Tco_0031025 [Tanacetum coccineum]